MARSKAEARQAVLENTLPIPESGCWIFMGAVNLYTGYGAAVSFEDTQMTPHRLVANAQPGDVVCHHCDNPSCIRPDHLYIGTHKTNYQDSVERGRRPKEVKKLTPRQRKVILESRLSSFDLASILGCDSSSIRYLRRQAGQQRKRGAPPKVTPKQLKTILESPLSAVELAKYMNLSRARISRIRQAHGQSRPVGRPRKHPRDGSQYPQPANTER